MPERVYTPDAVGVVDNFESVPDRRGVAQARIGDRVILFTDDSPRSLEGLSEPWSDGLLIYGEEADGTSWYVMRPSPESGACHWLYTNRAFDDGTHVIFGLSDAAGVRLPKADDFEAARTPQPEGHYPMTLVAWCLNAEGEVVRSSGVVPPPTATGTR